MNLIEKYGPIAGKKSINQYCPPNASSWRERNSASFWIPVRKPANICSRSRGKRSWNGASATAQ